MTNTTNPIDTITSLEQSQNGVTKAKVVSTTNVRLVGGAKNEYQDRVTRRTTFLALLAKSLTPNYDQLVKEELTKEGLQVADDFTLSPRKWGDRVPNTPLVTHGDKTYVELYKVKNMDTQLLLDGKPFTGDVEELRIYSNPTQTEKSTVVSHPSSYLLESIISVEIV